MCPVHIILKKVIDMLHMVSKCISRKFRCCSTYLQSHSLHYYSHNHWCITANRIYNCICYTSLCNCNSSHCRYIYIYECNKSSTGLYSLSQSRTTDWERQKGVEEPFTQALQSTIKLAQELARRVNDAM